MSPRRRLAERFNTVHAMERLGFGQADVDAELARIEALRDADGLPICPTCAQDARRYLGPGHRFARVRPGAAGRCHHCRRPTVTPKGE